MCTCAAHRMQAHRRAWHGIAPSPPSTRRLPLHPRTRVPRPERRRRLRACTAVLRLRLPTRRWRLNASEGGGRTRELPILSTSSTTRLVVILRQLSPGDPRSAVLPGRDRGRKHTRREPGDDKSAVCASTHGHLGAVARSWLGSHILVECVVWNAVAGRESRKRGMRGRTGKPRAWNAWPDGKAASASATLAPWRLLHTFSQWSPSPASSSRVKTIFSLVLLGRQSLPSCSPGTPRHR